MEARTIIIKALSCIEENGYVSKASSDVSGKESTALMMSQSFLLSTKPLLEDELKYGKRADEIINWIMSYNDSSNDYLMNCKMAVELAETTPEKTFGYLTSLPVAYDKHMEMTHGEYLITTPNNFAGDPGTSLVDHEVTVLSVTKHDNDSYYMYRMVDKNGCLIIYYWKSKKKASTPPSIKVGDVLQLSAYISKNKFTTPFATVVIKPIFRII